ncbi:MAG: NAD(P)/FAD-dependent oxidoreductase [Myxococcales bacterium]|nr:NAD(P)/FAD-dependent oxidoreductase [Myxococcales bacterium]MCB9753045.1 NAD(P)/FAD-dependent oxidoreductase [Myxococcales bacterium]
MSERAVDVAIIGGGLAGNLLARQLRRTCPAVSVAVFERNEEPAYKVGESTVELATNYLLRKQGLSTYLYDEHLPKNGLRFFFDSEARDTALTEMTEIGSRGMLWVPSFQLHRGRLERDLLRFNAEDGVDVQRGAKVRVLDMSTEPGGRHRVEVTGPDGVTRYACRWLIDASGRASVIARRKGLRTEEPHSLAAAWGRLDGVADLEAVPDPAWHERAHYTARSLSTVHFCYPGYWIWLIPLRGQTSIGVVCERARFQDAWRKPEGLMAFVREHAALADLVKGARWIDHGSYGRLSYGTKQYFSTERWGLIGEAAAFSDPFYSPGSDFIALENDFLTDLIARDHAGEALEERCEVYNEFMHFRFEATMLLYRDLYATLGSFELFRIKLIFDLLCYYNLWLHSYARDEHLDLRTARAQLRRKDFILQAMRNFSGAFQRLVTQLHAEGRYFAGNRGRFDYRLERVEFLPRVGELRKRKDITRTTEAIFNEVRDLLLDLSRSDAAPERARLPLHEFMTDAAIA